MAFTIKELREMVNLPDTKTVIKTSDVDGLDKRIQGQLSCLFSKSVTLCVSALSKNTNQNLNNFKARNIALPGVLIFIT